MDYFIQLFHERKQEIASFLDLMEFLERKNNQKAPNKETTFFQEFFYSGDEKANITFQSTINIMKSNIALMLYNIIEFTISGLMDNIYRTIIDQGLSYLDVNQDIQQLWRESMLKAARDPNANHNTILKKNSEMIDYVVQKKTLEIQARDFIRVGNLDGIEIQKTFEAHGIKFKPSKDNYRPEKLKFVKTKRNELAHGSISFTDAMRDSTIIEMKDDTSIINSFLEELIDIVEQYCENAGYKCAN